METPEDELPPEIPGEVIDIPDFPEIPPGEEPDHFEVPDETLDPADTDNAKVEGE